MNNILSKYANLLVNYCLEIKGGEKLFIQTTTIAEPLVREVYRAALKAGAIVVETDFIFREKSRTFLTEASEEQLKTVSPFYKMAMETFDAYLHIRAPFNLREDANIASVHGGTEGWQSKIRGEAMKDISNTYFERTAKRGQKGGMKRNLCQYPTDAAAQEAGMCLSEYEHFVFNACKLFEDDPMAAWLGVRQSQQRIVDYLNGCKSVRYVGENMDISFGTEGRIWMNSDGQTNMPSGEVYTSPVEDSVNGVVHFSYPCLYNGHEVEDVTLWVKDGLIEKWQATQVACDFAVPTPPAGFTLNNRIYVAYTPGAGGAPTEFLQVSNAAACAANSFYVQTGRVIFCPQTCASVRMDAMAQVAVRFSCEPMIE